MRTLHKFFGIRLMYEATLSLVVAWMVIWANRMTQNPRVFPMWEQSKVLSYLYWRHIIDEPGTVLEQVFWSLLLGVFIFGSLRLLSRLRFAEQLLATFGGAIVLLGFPLFYVLGFSASLDHRLPSSAYIELVFISLVAFGCYLLRQRIAFVVLASCVFVLHFSYWGWLTGNYVSAVNLLHIYAPWTAGFWISFLFHFGFPLLSTCAALCWAILLHQRRTSPAEQLQVAG